MASRRADPHRIANRLARLGREGERQDPALVDMLTRPMAEGERPEERLLELGLLSERDLALQLSRTSGLEFVGLRNLELDTRLFTYIPLELCERETVVPVTVGPEALTVATAFPRPELSSAEDRFPRLRFDYVIASRGEILQALRTARGGHQGRDEVAS